jgi:acyl dehydratase
MPLRYFEDFQPGAVVELGSRTLDEAAIVAFARDYDPQPFHTDPEAARSSDFGGLIASGWQTVGVYMRLLVDGCINGTVSLGSPGVEEIRWLVPVRPGDTLRARFTVLEARPSRSRPDRGTVVSLGEVTNQKGEVVMTLRGMGIFGRRPR